MTAHSDHDRALRCILGVDLRPASEGPIAWTRWARAAADPPPDIVAVHALRVRDRLEYPGVAEEVVRSHVIEFLRAHAAEYEVRIYPERPAAQALADAAVTHKADLLVIGRRSPIDGDSIVRLGTVARRVLRALTCPALVCPADLTPADIPAGPVMLAVHPHQDSEQAVAFGKRYAAMIGRPVVAMSVLPAAFPASTTYAPSPGADPAERERREEELRTWLTGHGIAEAPLIAEGPVVPGIIAAANELRACTIVCGARMISRAGGILSSSVGTALAGVARVPTLIVPPQ